jgi:class 3 adenylate cyclase
MGEHFMERRLAAILAADVVGYSKLVQADEAATLRRMKAIWAEVFETNITGHRGRIFKIMGDGALAEFASVVDAVECAVAIQNALRARNAKAGDEPPIDFRIGINLGDIVIDGDDVLGDGVNVAARLEAAAPSGGVLTSDHVHSQVRGKVGVTFIDAGEVHLKNIDGPLRVWRWEGEDAPAKAAAGTRERLSIAVLPFNNMSADPEQRGHHHRVVEDSLVPGDRAQLDLHLQGPGGGREARGPGTGRALRAGGQRAQGRQPHPGHRPVDRRGDRAACLGRALRPRARRYFRSAGRDHPHHRRPGRARDQRRRA